MEYNISQDDAVAIIEDKRLRYRIKDASGNDIDDFSEWVNVDFYLTELKFEYDDLDDLLTNAIIHKDETDGITFDIEPFVYVTLASSDTDGINRKNYYHRLFRTDEGHVTLLSHGIFPLV
jgi:hypothetical protein